MIRIYSAREIWGKAANIDRVRPVFVLYTWHVYIEFPSIYLQHVNKHEEWEGAY